MEQSAITVPYHSIHTRALAEEGEPLLKTRQEQPKAVADATDAPLLMYDASGTLPAQQFGDSSSVDQSVEGHHSDQMRRTVPGA